MIEKYPYGTTHRKISFILISYSILISFEFTINQTNNVLPK